MLHRFWCMYGGKKRGNRLNGGLMGLFDRFCRSGEAVPDRLAEVKELQTGKIHGERLFFSNTWIGPEAAGRFLVLAMVEPDKKAAGCFYSLIFKKKGTVRAGN